MPSVAFREPLSAISTMPTDSNLPDRKLHRLPPAVYATAEYAYSFTVCARHHGKPFQEQSLADEIIRSLLWTKRQYNWLLFCYWLVPNHLLFVCRLNADSRSLINRGSQGAIKEGVLDHLARFKSYTTTLSWNHGFQGKLWQSSSYDRVLDLQRPFEEVVQYVLENPVRAGLVTDWQQWPYSRVVDRW